MNDRRWVIALLKTYVRYIKWAVVMSAVLLLSGMTSSVWAERSYYFGALLPYNTIDTFGGGTGTGVFLGYRTRVSEASLISSVKSGYVLSYMQSDHKLKGSPIHARYQLIMLEIKYDFRTQSPTQPYLAFGGGFHKLDVDGPEGTLEGYGYNVRAGVQYFLIQRFSVGSDISFRAARVETGPTLRPGGVWVGFAVNAALHF